MLFTTHLVLDCAVFPGAYGNDKEGMLHEISPPEELDENSIQYYIDCGRAKLQAIKDLLARLEILHEQNPIESVLLGKGFLP